MARRPGDLAPDLTPGARAKRGFPLGRFALIVLFGWIVASGTIATLAWVELRAGIDELERGRAALDLGDLATDRPAALLDRAGRRFERASGWIDNPALLPWRWFPVAGRQLRSVDALATTARDAGGAGERAAREVAAALADVPAAGPGRIAAVERIDAAMAGADAALADLELGPDEALVGPLASRRDQVTREVAETRRALADARAVVGTVRRLLVGPQRYLLVAANNAEMRAGVGMFLSIGVLETEGGRFRLGEMRPAGDLVLPPGGVPVTGDLADRWGFMQPGTEWRNLAPSPRFPPSAEVAARMWPALTGEQVDGVLAVDVPAIAALLDATGPVVAGGAEVSAATAEDFLLHDQYEQYSGVREQDDRRELLGELARSVVDRLEEGRVEPDALATSLRRAVRGRHLLAWSSDPDDQAGWAAVGAAGELRPDSLALALLNRGGNKLDPFQRLAARVETEAAGRDRVAVRVRVQVENRTPAGEPAYVAGPARGLDVEAGTYVGLLALNVPGGAGAIGVEGGPRVADGPDGPTRVIATQVELRRGESAEVTFRFELRLPRGRSSASVHLEPSARVPPTRWHVGDEAWWDDKPRTLKLAR